MGTPCNTAIEVDGGNLAVGAGRPRFDNAHGRVSSGEVPSWTAAPGPFVFYWQSASSRHKRPSGSSKFSKVCRSSTATKCAVASTPSDASKSTFEIEFTHSYFRAFASGASMVFSTHCFARSSSPRTFGFHARSGKPAARKTWLSAQPGQRHRVSTITGYSTRNGRRSETSSSITRILDAIGDCTWLGHSLIASSAAINPARAHINCCVYARSTL